VPRLCRFSLAYLELGVGGALLNSETFCLSCGVRIIKSTLPAAPPTMVKGKQKNGGKVPPSPGLEIDDGLLDLGQSQALNTQAFSDLSQKIQAQFSNLTDGRLKTTSRRTKNREKVTKQTKASEETPQITKNIVPSRGKKRDNQGLVKAPVNPKILKKPAKEIPETEDILKEEVYKLGGTADDLALVAGIESESELDVESAPNKASGGSKFEKGLRNGIAEIMKQIDACGRPEPSQDDAEEKADSQGERISKEEAAEEQVSRGFSTSAPYASDKFAPKSGMEKSHPSVTPRSDWFNVELPPINNSNISKTKVSSSDVQRLHEHAKSLLDTENETFKASQQSSSSQKFYSTVIASGTLSDKISALTLAVQESPLHNVKALETLVNLGKKRSRAQAVDVLRALKDLFAQGSLLPSDRKLHAFSGHPDLLAALSNSTSWRPDEALPSSLRPQHLIVWAYEGWLKEKYFEVLKTLEIWCNDEIEFSKSKAVHFVYELLKEKPEQESNLLRLLTNKLGDPSKKIASQTSYLIMQLMAAHPLMKMTIISSIDSDLLFRPGQSLHAKYYAVITLNQTALSSNEEQVASKLLSVYFGLFVGLLGPGDDGKRISNRKVGVENSKDGNIKSPGKQSNDTENAQADDLREKLTSAILTGINRAYPYTNTSNQR
jgi:ribosome biogenesis protein MAK21